MVDVGQEWKSIFLRSMKAVPLCLYVYYAIAVKHSYPIGMSILLFFYCYY